MAIDRAKAIAQAEAARRGDFNALGALLRDLSDAIDALSDTELGFVDGVTAGTVTVSKAVVVDANGDITGFRHIGATGTVTAGAIAGADSILNIDGLAAAQGGAVTITGGTSSTTGNVGGAANVVGGVPGATAAGGPANLTGAAGGATSGKGGAANVTGGAGTGTDQAGGSVVLTPGAPNGTGLAGGVFNRGVSRFIKQAAPVAKPDGAAVMTAAEMISGIVVHTVTTGCSLTTPTGAAISAGCPTDLAVGDAFDLTIISIGTGADDIVTLTAGDGAVTFVGSVTIGPNIAGTDDASATFRFRNTGAGTWVGYRL